MKKNSVVHENKLRKDIINYLIDFPLFDALKGNQLDIVAEHMNYYEIDKGEILFKEGDKGGGDHQRRQVRVQLPQPA